MAAARNYQTISPRVSATLAVSLFNPCSGLTRDRNLDAHPWSVGRGCRRRISPMAASQSCFAGLTCLWLDCHHYRLFDLALSLAKSFGKIHRKLEYHG